MTQDTLPSNPPVARRTDASENKDIEIRNVDRALRNAQHTHNPTAHPDAVSDDESLITVSDVPINALSPLSKVKKLAQKLSPTSARDLYLAFMTTGTSKHAHNDDEPKPATKKLKEEIAISAGMNMPLRFSPYLPELYLNNLHFPLSLFTSNNLDIVNNSYHSIATVKHNAPGSTSSDKQIHMLDTASFDREIRSANETTAVWF
ncbi:hypothetical protein B0H14DRAFT_3497429 [Mycena olivaceomarginata]|nr:hypothetical protein B0H14DRAFT_3497429 [Mycena olivaceomarginata]